MVPPHTHRRNLAERAIQTWKNHFKAGLASIDPNFPLTEWDRLIPQANITLNLLRGARTNPMLSAYSYIFGEFNFAATPMAPPGTKIVAHVKPSIRRTWELNGELGWYVGPSMHHYRCVQCYFPRTKTPRDCDTVTFFPTHVPFPEIKLDDFLRQAATDIITILTSPPSTTTPSLEAGDPVRNALLTLATQLKRIQPMPITAPSTPPATSPRVQPTTIPTHIARAAPVPRVKFPPITNITTVGNLQQRSSALKNARFNNITAHRYPLRSKTLPTRKHLPSLHNKGTNFRNLAAKQLLAQHLFQANANHIYRENGTKESIDSLLNGPTRHVWVRSLSNEWGRLAQGNDGGVQHTYTIDFIHKHEVPVDRDVTYATFVLDHRPLKTEEYRVRITVGGNRLSYDNDSGSPAANLLEKKS